MTEKRVREREPAQQQRKDRAGGVVFELCKGSVNSSEVTKQTDVDDHASGNGNGHESPCIAFAQLKMCG